MKSSLRTALALLVTSVPWLAMIAQSQQQEMPPGVNSGWNQSSRKSPLLIPQTA